MIVEFSLVSKKRTHAYYFFKYTFLGTSLILFFFTFFVQGMRVSILAITSILIFSGLGLGFVKQHIHIGKVIFYESHLSIVKSISKIDFQLSEISNLKFIIYSYCGEQNWSTTLGLTVGLTGLGNYTKFKDKDEVYHIYEFFIKSKFEKNQLKKIKAYWKEHYPEAFA